ncbi:hypothetical protein LguiA_001694 [Lonicera macranthoides]
MELAKGKGTCGGTLGQVGSSASTWFWNFFNYIWGTESQFQQRKIVKRERLMESELPDEIIDEILSRLPVQSLLRFKCVCKRWLSTISDPNFHQKTEIESILVVESLKTLAASLISIDANKFVTKSFSVPCNERENYYYENIIVSNSCNGLVIIGIRESFFLFNPSTRHFAKVLVLNCSCQSNVVMAGLCYDTYTNGYKAVIRFMHRFEHGRVVVVASLKTKRCVRINFPFDVTSTKAGPVVNGMMHWTVNDSVNNRQSKKIIYFDPSRNLFEEFPSPPSQFGGKKAIFHLGVSGGYLCMVRLCRFNIEVLIMKKYGIRESWTSLTTMPLPSHPFLPFIFTNNGDIMIVQKKNKSQLLADNPEKKTTRIFDLPNVENLLLDGVSIVQNIAWPSGYEWDEIRHKNHEVEEWLKTEDNFV